MQNNNQYRSHAGQYRRGNGNSQRTGQIRGGDDHDIYHRHYERNDNRHHDDRRDYDAGRPNHLNRGREVYADGPDLRGGYGYNQGRNSASNSGGRAYGQSYGQYFQGSDLRRHSNPRDYQGAFDPRYPGPDYGPEDDFNDRYDDDRYDLHEEFRRYGYQGSGYNEGFGQRAGHRNERHWLDDDEYRRGHAQRHRGVGKFGSR